MRVLVLGGGAIGVTTAYALMADGHEVTVVERNAGPAEETSFANAGQIAPGHAYAYAYAWASPQAPGMLFRSLYRDDQALRFHPAADPRLWAWSFRFLRECTAEPARLNVGHGHMGWTMAAGSARLTADLIAGRSPEIPLEGMTLQ